LLIKLLIIHELTELQTINKISFFEHAQPFQKCSNAVKKPDFGEKYSYFMPKFQQLSFFGKILNNWVHFNLSHKLRLKAV